MYSPYRSIRTRDLLAEGFSKAHIRLAVDAGALVRVRRGLYVSAATPDACREAAALGGRADCVTALQELGVFVLDKSPLHMQIWPGTTRVPDPGDAVRHWRATEAAPDQLLVSPVEAVRQAVFCLSDPYAIVATVDSALHAGLIQRADLSEVFRGTPRRKRRLVHRLNRDSESGAESIVRMLLEELGCEVRVQAQFVGIGRVDFLVDGWLVVECDSRKYHSSPEQQAKDRRRDRMLAALGYVPFRVMAEDVYYHREAVREALRGMLAQKRPRRGHPLRRPLELGRAA